MATLGDLKARVADEILKRNLTTQIASHISRAIEFYASRRWWFNVGQKTGVLVTGDEYLTLQGVRLIDDLRVNGHSLRERPAEEIEAWQSAGASSGEPGDYVRLGDELRFYPTPNDAYAYVVLGVLDQPALASDASSNAWTNEAADLIAARTRFTLYRDVLRDPEGATLATDAMKEADSLLQMTTMRRSGRGRVKGHL